MYRQIRDILNPSISITLFVSNFFVEVTGIYFDDMAVISKDLEHFLFICDR